MHTETANFGARDLCRYGGEKTPQRSRKYIEDQLKQDRESDQVSIYDPRDPFTGSK